MNIDQYREIKAQEEATAKGEDFIAQAELPTIDSFEGITSQEEQVTVRPEPQEVPTVEESNPEPQQQETISTFTKDGVEYNVDELLGGTTQLQQQLAQAQEAITNLTKQQQSQSTAVEYYNKMMEDPEYAKVFAEKNGLQFVDPQTQAVREIESKYQDLLLKQEIDNMVNKYPDFNPEEVIQVALQKGVRSLEDAYLLNKASKPQEPVQEVPDVATLTEQIRQQILDELQSHGNTNSIIGMGGSGGRQVTTSAPQLSAKEMGIARAMDMTPEEYAKWRDIQ